MWCSTNWSSSLFASDRRQADVADSDWFKATIALAAPAAQVRDAATRQPKVSGCLAIADVNCSATWESNCEAQAKENRSQYADCIGQGIGRAFCHSLHGDFQTSDCRLPHHQATPGVQAPWPWEYAAMEADITMAVLWLEFA